MFNKAKHHFVKRFLEKLTVLIFAFSPVKSHSKLRRKIVLLMDYQFRAKSRLIKMGEALSLPRFTTT